MHGGAFSVGTGKIPFNVVARSYLLREHLRVRK